MNYNNSLQIQSSGELFIPTHTDRIRITTGSNVIYDETDIDWSDMHPVVEWGEIFCTPDDWSGTETIHLLIENMEIGSYAPINIDTDLAYAVYPGSFGVQLTNHLVNDFYFDINFYDYECDQ